MLKLIRKIKTNSLEPGEPKDPSTCTLFQIFSAFANEEEVQAKKAQYKAGAGWGDLKNELFEYLNEKLKEPRERYNELLQNPAFIEAELRKGAEKARAEAAPLLKQVREAVGLKSFV